MASPVLHIKDAYFFEVPKILWPSHRHAKADFPGRLGPLGSGVPIVGGRASAGELGG